MEENNKGIQNLIRSGLFLAIAIVFQLIGKNFPQVSQLLVGPAVNSVLLLTTYVCGTNYGIAAAALTPILAFLLGQFPAPLAPFIPFIMIGNVVYVLAFGILKNKTKVGEYIGVIVGSLLKFLFLYFSASKLVILLGLGIPQKALSKLGTMMGVPQLITALFGGVIAIIIIEILKRRKVIR
ncbi:MAG: transporter component [Clostridiales bacterium]|nr:transporter component [Clostridiales bacterium]